MLPISEISTDYSVGIFSGLGIYNEMLNILAVFTDYSVGITGRLRTEK